MGAMEDTIPVFLHTEVAEPRRRIVRSDAALYLLLLLGAVGCILLSHWLAERFAAMRLLFQIALYAALFSGGYAVYRLRLMAFRYTLTDRELLVYRIVGRKETLLLTVPLRGVTVGAWQNGLPGYEGRTYVGRRADSLCLTYDDGRPHAVCISPSDTLHTKLLAAIDTCKAGTEGDTIPSTEETNA